MKSISDENLGNIIGLTFPNENLKEYVEAFKPNFPIFRYPTNEIYEKVHRVPLLIVIKDGRVEKVLDAHDIPSGPLLAKVIN